MFLCILDSTERKGPSLIPRAEARGPSIGYDEGIASDTAK